LSATGVVDVLFGTYTITADHAAFTFNASGLPAGLTVNSTTGAISGTPTELGDFDVTITASNTLSTGSATLNLAIVNTAAGPGVVVEPDVPPGTGAVNITFTNVTQAGDTTVTVAPAGPAPPTGFGLGSPAVYYNVETTATFSGLNEICFNYAGIDFGASTPRLFHNEGGAWVDITTSLSIPATTICGTTSSFSPFVILVSTITRSGFHQPVSPVASYLNTVKGGSTVPLTFNVYVNGIEKTDTAGLVFTVASLPCSGGTEDAVDFVTTGSTELRYSGHEFTQNWKTPKGAGACYIVRMTTTIDGGSLSAMFKMK
jgi:hypothetical protein